MCDNNTSFRFEKLGIIRECTYISRSAKVESWAHNISGGIMRVACLRPCMGLDWAKMQVDAKTRRWDKRSSSWNLPKAANQQKSMSADQLNWLEFPWSNARYVVYLPRIFCWAWILKLLLIIIAIIMADWAIIGLLIHTRRSDCYSQSMQII